MNQYLCKLKFDFKLSLDGVKKIRDNYKDLHQYMMFTYPKEYESPELHALMDSLGLFISHHEIFYTPPRGKLPIHVDHHKFSFQSPNMAKINWILDCTGGDMVWWEPKPGSPLKYHKTPIGTEYLMYEEDQVTEVYRAEIGESTFINAGVPHSIHNNTDVGRWCLSHNINYKSDRTKNILISEVPELFKKYVL